DHTQPADGRGRAAAGRLGQQVLEEGDEVGDAELDLVDEVDEERVAVAVLADVRVQIVQPGVQAGEVGRRQREGVPSFEDQIEDDPGNQHENDQRAATRPAQQLGHADAG